MTLAPWASQDRDKGVMTLRAMSAALVDKVRATKIAQRAAPDYTIANEIGVRPEGVPDAAGTDAKLDSAIEDNFKASIKSHDNLTTRASAAPPKTAPWLLKGSVKTPQQKTEAECLAKQVPNVQQVVNELKVKRASTPPPAHNRTDPTLLK